MNRIQQPALILLSVLLLVGLAGDSLGYSIYDPWRSWNLPPQLIVDSGGLIGVSDGDGGVTRTVNAINSSSAWNGAGTGTRVTAVSGNTGSFQLGDGVPMLAFRDPFVDCTGNCLAATYINYYSSAAIYDADIITNTSQAWASQGESCYQEYYVESVMVHEVGHLLGIGHSTYSSATMYPYAYNCSTGPMSTSSDDEAAVNHLYGIGFLALFEGNNGTQNAECELQALYQTVKFQSSSSPCTNDETRSLRIKHVKAGFRARVYDDPNCGTGDDWTHIQVKQDVDQYLVGTFETDSNDSYVLIDHRPYNGLDGKISCLKSTYCGDAYCTLGESCSSCSADCGACPYCGDGSCNGSETCNTCSTDCGTCPTCDYDGFCEAGEDETCGDCCTSDPTDPFIICPE